MQDMARAGRTSRGKVGNFHLVVVLRDSLPSPSYRPLSKLNRPSFSQTMLAASKQHRLYPDSSKSLFKPLPFLMSSLASDRSSHACHSKTRRQTCFADSTTPPLILSYHRLLVFLASPSGFCVALVEEVAFIVATLELDQALEAHAERSLFSS